jgi:hypothetical protein
VSLQEAIDPRHRTNTCGSGPNARASDKLGALAGTSEAQTRRFVLLAEVILVSELGSIRSTARSPRKFLQVHTSLKFVEPSGDQLPTSGQEGKTTSDTSFRSPPCAQPQSGIIAESLPRPWFLAETVEPATDKASVQTSIFATLVQNYGRRRVMDQMS